MCNREYQYPRTFSKYFICVLAAMSVFVAPQIRANHNGRAANLLGRVFPLWPPQLWRATASNTLSLMMSSAVDVRRATFCGDANTDVKKGRAVAADLYNGVSVAAFIRHSSKSLTSSHTSVLRLSQSGLRTQTANQPKLIPPIFSPGQPRPWSLAWSVKALSLTSKSLA